MVKILGIDPSLRRTGFAVLNYNMETETIKVQSCGVLRTYAETVKGLDAVQEMLKRVKELASMEEFSSVDDVCIEFPANLFHAAFANAALLPVAGIAGGTAACFDLEKVRLVKPQDWNKRRKKEVTHLELQSLLGPIEKWKFLEVPPKSCFEHILDAAGAALWLLKGKYLENKAQAI